MAFHAVVLFFAMALLGVHVVGALTMPLFGIVSNLITRDPRVWYGIGGTVYQCSVGIATYVLGITVVGLPWWAAVIVAGVVFVTSYARPMESPYAFTEELELQRAPAQQQADDD
jgi:hypothetical protein